MIQPTPSREHLFKFNSALFSHKRQFSKRSNLSKCFDYDDLQFFYFVFCSVFTIRLSFVYAAKIAHFSNGEKCFHAKCFFLHLKKLIIFAK